MNSLSTVIFILSSLLYCCQSREFQFLNNGGETIWVGIQGNPGKENLAGGGFVLNPGQRINSIYSADDWAGRFWGRTGCNPGDNHCETGDCGNRLECGGNGGAPPASLAEITLSGWGGLDYYDISLVDGANTPISMEPLGGHGDGSQYSCTKAGCGYDFRNDCPDELKLYSGDGRVIGCKSACLAFNTDQYCCRGAYNQADTCRSSDWPVDYPKFFKDRCPDAYSYAFDDHKSTFTCQAPAYLITYG